MIGGWLALLGDWIIVLARIIVVITWLYAYRRVRIRGLGILGLAAVVEFTGFLYIYMIGLAGYSPRSLHAGWISLVSYLIFIILIILGVWSLLRTFKGKRVVSGGRW
ncbi:MAG: hypothetical protein R6U44_10030 [Archaeoglobaceae archaeon]